MSWTEDRDFLLKHMWNVQKLKSAEIGARLDVSKNAVIGRARRLGLDARPSPIKRTVTTDKKVAEVQVETKAKPKHASPKKASEPVCCWPFGDPGSDDFHYCGDSALAGKPYCAEHYKKATYTSDMCCLCLSTTSRDTHLT